MKASIQAALAGCILLNAFSAEVDPRMVPPRNGVTDKLPSIPPTAAADSSKTFQILDGFRMDLLAAEPLVASPVAMTYDENGRAYVCEMRDYPYTDKAHHQRNQENPTDAAIGTVRLLEDIDGDGVFDKSTVFAEGLSWPTGIACWKGGVFVAATPDLWYFKDTDGDGKADLRRKVFTGFRKLNVQSVMNTLIWGLDNKIYGSGSSNGGQIRPADQPGAKAFSMARNDFRFDPVTEQFEVLSGGARFGATFDDWGHRFLCDIRNPAQHVVLPREYLARNPHLAVRTVLNDMAESGDQLPVYRISPPELWREVRAKRWAGERDIIMPRSELVGAGVVTSSSGVTSYRGAAYPSKYYGNVFVCECAGNLFYRLQLSANGPTFKATRSDEKAEIVASRDNWFRPVNLINAPDGTLHVTDMYRENIEHPWSIPDDIHAAVDLESGRDRGRIWRLSPPKFRPPEPPHLGRATTATLVATLENPNSWWRETAQRLLFEHQDRAAIPRLQKLAERAKTGQSRLHAFWSLEGLGSLENEAILFGLKDNVPGVRENAIKLAERHIAPALDPKLIKALLSMATDPDPFVRFQLALTLGQLPSSRTVPALAAIAKRDANDLWTRTAVLSSVATTGHTLLITLLADAQFCAQAAAREFIRELSEMIGARGAETEVIEIVTAANQSAVSESVMIGVAEGLRRSGKTLRGFISSSMAVQAVQAFLTGALHRAQNTNPSAEDRASAIRLLAFNDFSQVREALIGFLGSNQPQEVQRAAIATLASFSSPEIGSLLLARWKAASPIVRSEIVQALLSGRNRVPQLLKAIEQAEIPANQIPFARRSALTRSSDQEVQGRARVLFAAGLPKRQEVLGQYTTALTARGDAVRGQAVFETTCATCHRCGELGKDVGPNLATVRQWSAEQVLINILDPNREAAPNFLSYTVETKDGKTLDGIIADESAASITLKQAGGVTETLLRRDILQLTGTGLSLMPEALETAITVQQMADLLAFLKQ